MERWKECLGDLYNIKAGIVFEEGRKMVWSGVDVIRTAKKVELGKEC